MRGRRVFDRFFEKNNLSSVREARKISVITKDVNEYKKLEDSINNMLSEKQSLSQPTTSNTEFSSSMFLTELDLFKAKAKHSDIKTNLKSLVAKTQINISNLLGDSDEEEYSFGAKESAKSKCYVVTSVEFKEDFMLLLSNLLKRLGFIILFDKGLPYKSRVDRFQDLIHKVLKSGDSKLVLDTYQLLLVTISFSKTLLNLIMEKVKPKGNMIIYLGNVVINKTNKLLGSSKTFTYEYLDRIKNLMDNFLDTTNTELNEPGKFITEFLNLYSGDELLGHTTYDQKYEFFIRWVFYRIWLFSEFKENSLLLFEDDKENDLNSIMLQEKIENSYAFAKDAVEGIKSKKEKFDLKKLYSK
ncbi:MAG: hypothetical protein JW791_05195 [Nanoarchaeota archaeon]|nr:hypothetical protein [Nanoarchaeota archaeon]